ncbi:MAG: glycosyltransferase family 4 protein [Bacteroidales bacterium]|nr:glycosyltransferase family 4 protein [Bacteroidales bacterium]
MGNKNILIPAAYFYPEHAASPYLGENKNEAFVNAGYKIDVFAPTPCRGVDNETRNRYKNIKTEEFLNGNLVVHRFSLFKEGKNPIGRAIRYSLCWVEHLVCCLKAKDADLIYVGSTPPIQGLIGVCMKKLKKTSFVYNLQDIFPDSLVGTGLAKKGGLLWKIGRVIENTTYKHADKIIVISQDFKKNIMAKGVPEDKIEVIYNWVEQDNVHDVPRVENKLISKYGLDPNKFYVTYCGNIGLTQNMDMLLEIAQELSSNENIHFVLNGEGAYKTEVEKIISEKDIENVTLLPFQPYEDIAHVFSLGDVGLVISKPGVGANSVPSKTWSIMSASRPVLASFDENELKDIITDNECGIFCKGGDKEALKNAILKMSANPDLCKEYGANGRQFVMDNLTREVGTKKYVDVINKVLNQNK